MKNGQQVANFVLKYLLLTFRFSLEHVLTAYFFLCFDLLYRTESVMEKICFLPMKTVTHGFAREKS
jgi:hypothetical protein